MCDTVSFMHDALEKKQRILIEGANAMMLDIDFGESKRNASATVSAVAKFSL